MEKKLIIVKTVGQDVKIDKKVKDIVKKTKTKDITIYCNKFILNETGEYIRSKGVKIYPLSDTPIAQLGKDFDKVVEIDEWAKGKGEQFLKEKKEDKKAKK